MEEIYLILIYIVIVAVMTIIQEISFFNKQFYRFCIVGVCNTVNYFVIYSILHKWVEYIIAHVVAFILSALVSYVLTTKYTFNDKCTWETFVRFPLTFLPNLFMSTIGTIALVDFGIVTEDYASLVTMILAIPITFFVSKILYTKGRRNEKN